MNARKAIPALRERDWTQDFSSALFLLVLAANTALIVTVQYPLLRAALVLPQALLLIGCQEAKHLCSHGNFIRPRVLNDAVGIFCGALFWVNFFTFRYFHLEHHRNPCNHNDPEAKLYKLSPATRWVWLLSPLELPWNSFHISRVGAAYVPASSRLRWMLTNFFVAMVVTALAIAAWKAPQAVLWAYLIPLALFGLIDFPLTQSEHYGVVIASADGKRDMNEIANDVVLPRAISWMTLYRGLHNVHHNYPALHWSAVPGRLQWPVNSRAISYWQFVRLWFAKGPRLWETEASQMSAHKAR